MNEWIVNVEYVYNRILFSINLKKEGNCAICNNIDGSGGQC
jgi:hypothetical protein